MLKPERFHQNCQTVFLADVRISGLNKDFRDVHTAPHYKGVFSLRRERPPPRPSGLMLTIQEEPLTACETVAID